MQSSELCLSVCLSVCLVQTGLLPSAHLQNVRSTPRIRQRAAEKTPSLARKQTQTDPSCVVTLCWISAKDPHLTHWEHREGRHIEYSPLCFSDPFFNMIHQCFPYSWIHSQHIFSCLSCSCSLWVQHGQFKVAKSPDLDVFGRETENLKNICRHKRELINFKSRNFFMWGINRATVSSLVGQQDFKYIQQ